MHAARAPLTAMVALAIADLARRLSIAPAAIHTVHAGWVTWPDGSLGCPQPGMVYTQQLVGGVFIQLRAGDDLYNFHGGESGAPFLCESAEEVLPEDLPEDPRV